VAVAAGDRVLWVEHRDLPHGQAEALLPMVERAMREARLEASALELIAVTTGPGSFTGIRVGLAAARGIALGLDLPLIGVTGFEAAAAALRGADPADGFLLVALESRRVDLFIQLFAAGGHALGVAAAVLPEALAEIVTTATGAGPLTVTGDAAPRAVAALAARGCASIVGVAEPAAIGAQRAALRRWRRGERNDRPRPFYLRPPDVTLAARPLLPGRS
jgi:tRNA threonylcarbamoyladenosine biosynthesis protein TsaB